MVVLILYLKGNALRYKFEREQVIPYTTLPSNRGVKVDLWNYKQNKNLVLFFYHGNKCKECVRKLKELIDSYVDINSLDSEVIAITVSSTINSSGQLDGIQTPFPILIDEVGDFTKKFTYIDDKNNTPFPSIFITDRYGAVRFQRIAEEANHLPTANDLINWLLLIQSECPECSPL